MWFRRDLRLADNPALLAAIENSDEIVPLFILDPVLIKESGNKRLAYLANSLRALDDSLSGRLHVVVGDQVEVLKSYNAAEVHISKEFEPYGAARDARVEAAGIKLIRTGSPYAVAPGQVRKPSDDTPYRVYTPFFKNWAELASDRPVALEPGAKFETLGASNLPQPTKASPIKVIAGEAFALRTFERFKKRALDEYDEQRNRADISGTSHLSHALAHGEIHPRTLLVQLGDSAAHTVFRKEIAWREFYADVLWHNPHSLTEYYDPKFAKMRYDSGDLAAARLEAWQQGKTGYPMVDAGMRQLLQTGWMHNRVRMIVASFLVKDLHLEWQQGAEWFERHLSDFDPASNTHGWQWTAGCGTDASPYFRIFNPISQGLKFDPNGDYVRRFVPELAHIQGAAVHEPWLLIDGLAKGYPAPIVDHSVEREESLARLAELKTL